MSTIIVAIITSLGVVANTIISKRLSASDIIRKLNKLDKKIEEVDISNLKQYLIRTMTYMESNNIDKEELIYFYEQYDRYINYYHKNSYIHDKYDKLKKRGIL